MWIAVSGITASLDLLTARSPEQADSSGDGEIDQHVFWAHDSGDEERVCRHRMLTVQRSESVR